MLTVIVLQPPISGSRSSPLPGWISGGHPHINDGIVVRMSCFVENKPYVTKSCPRAYQGLLGKRREILCLQTPTNTRTHFQMRSLLRK